MHTLAKPAQHSPLKIDAAMAAVLAWEARGDARAAGAVALDEHKPASAEPEPKRWEPDRALPGTALSAEHLTPAAVVGPMGDHVLTRGGRMATIKKAASKKPVAKKAAPKKKSPPPSSRCPCASTTPMSCSPGRQRVPAGRDGGRSSFAATSRRRTAS
jgi:hypothetical protein